MVYIKANEFRYLALHLLIVFVPVAAVVVPLVVKADESLVYGMFIAFDISVTVSCLRWLWTPAFGDSLTHSDRFDVTIDERGVGGPIREWRFEFAQQEVVPVDTVDLSQSRHNTVFGSYLALKDGRRMIVSSFIRSIGQPGLLRSLYFSIVSRRCFSSRQVVRMMPSSSMAFFTAGSIKAL